MEPSPKREAAEAQADVPAATEATPAAAVSGRRKFTKLLQPFAVIRAS
jgi:hypothetical protein